MDLQQAMVRRVMELQAVRRLLPLQPLPRTRVMALQVVATARRHREALLPEAGLKWR